VPVPLAGRWIETGTTRADARPRGDLIVGGTTVIGGGGSHPTEREAKLFIWDTKTKQKIFETVPVSGANALNDLIAVKGRVFGIAGGTPVGFDPAKDQGTRRAPGVTLFLFDPATHAVSHLTPLDFGTIYNSVAVGPDGKIWAYLQTASSRSTRKAVVFLWPRWRRSPLQVVSQWTPVESTTPRIPRCTVTHSASLAPPGPGFG